MVRHIFMQVSGAVFSLAVLAGCSKEAAKPGLRPPAPVVAVAAAIADIPQRIQAVGTVEASESVIIRPQITGELAAVYVAEGQEVSKGQKLFMMDPRSWQASLKKAEASLNRNRVVMENAHRDYERYAQLVKDGIVTQEQAEGFRTKAESAAADMDADRAVVENARLQLHYCTITAPISGRLGNLAVHRGNVVKAHEAALVTLNAIVPVNVSFALPERDLAEIRKRIAQGRLVVTAEIQGGLTEKGTVAFLDNTVDPATGTIRLKATFANAAKRLWPGQFVQVAVTLAERKGVVAVPSQAVQVGQQGSFVFVVKPDMTSETRKVVPGPAYQGLTVIEQGLTAGEQVVVDGQLRIAPGGKVEIKKPGEKPEEPAGNK